MLASGMTYIIIAAGIDLSIGSLVVFSSVAFAEVMTRIASSSGVFDQPRHLGLGIAVGVAAALVAGLGWGIVNGYLIGYHGIPAFVVTLGTLQETLGAGKLFGAIPWLVILAAAVVGVLWVVLSQTRYGMRTYAIGSSLDASTRAGINVRFHVVTLYGLMGLLAASWGMRKFRNMP